MQSWYDLGKFKTHSMKEFKKHAQKILKAERIQGSLASLFISEPTLGTWGNTQRDLPRHVMDALLMQIEPQSGFRLTSESGVEKMQLGGYPEIGEALQNDSAKMLVATMPNGIRTLSQLILTKQKKTWWKLW